uniref:Uncharacterized protein n=1 Tax=Morchella brunnea TaxID=1174671 RepID=A0A8K1I8G0_9PEZI|nr:hypothetical protein LK370_mgp252 [Morchella brunnea]UBU98604.1 hypothetical protein [Morchella brunnea]
MQTWWGSLLGSQHCMQPPATLRVPAWSPEYKCSPREQPQEQILAPLGRKKKTKKQKKTKTNYPVPVSAQLTEPKPTLFLNPHLGSATTGSELLVWATGKGSGLATGG